MSDSLPTGFAIRLGRQVRVEDDGAALVGGSPTRVLYLTEVARAMIVGRELRTGDRASTALARRLLDTGMAYPLLDELPDAPPGTVTIVVPARDRPGSLDRLLASAGGGVPVIVVDDCSQDPDPVAAVALSHGAQLVALPVNVGPAGARNAGLRRVQTPFVAFVDSDMVLDSQTIPLLMRHFADPSVALVGPRILGLGGATPNWVARYEQVRSSLDMGRDPALVRPLSPVAWLPAACMVARVDALGEGFAVEMRVAEDVDLVLRLTGLGWSARYEPAVLAWHEHRVRFTEWLGRKAFYGTGAQLLAARHPGAVAPAVLTPWSAGLVVALLAQRRWSIPVALSLTGITAVRIARRLPRSEHPLRMGVRLAVGGMVSALFQASGLLLRHWWPVTLAAGLGSKRVRRASLVASVADVVIEYSRTQPRLDPLRFGLLRRLDDLAYGAGVWFGAVTGRSIWSLLPTWRRAGAKGGRIRLGRR